MSLLTDRSAKILKVLLNREEAIVIQKLAQRFDVSARTIRSDLKKLQKWLKTKDVKLITKPRVGVWLEIDNEQKSSLEKRLLKEKNNQDPFSPAKREKYILKRLLQADQRYTMKELAEELYVSRTTIYNDLEEVERWLDKYNLELAKKRNCGVKIKGSEKNWRKAITDLLAELKGDQELKEILESDSDLETNSRIDSQTYQELKSLFGDINFRDIEKILKEAETELGFLFTDEAFVGLVIHIAISVERLEKNKDIKMSQEQLRKLKTKDEFEVAEFIVAKLEEKLTITIPEAEIGYISLHILGAKLQQNIQTKSVTDVIENTDSEIVEVAQKIIKLTSEVLEVDFNSDQQLLVGLVLHLRPAINRLKYGMSLRNPLLDRIKENYPSVFGAAWATSTIFEKELGIKVNEEEIGYIALHLGAALERINKKTRAIIVCSSGIGTSQLIASRLAKRLSGIEIVDLLGAHKLNAEDLREIDLVISTIPLEDINQPVVQVSPLVTDNDITLIKQKADHIIEDKERANQNLEFQINQVNQILDDDLIFIDLELDQKSDVIEFLSKQLLEKGLIKEEFIDSALAREKITSTGVGNEVAIPHGKEEYVLKSKIAVATLKNPVNWGSETVEVIFLLALKDKQSKVFFKHFHKIIDDRATIQKLKKAKTKEKIKNTII